MRDRATAEMVWIFVVGVLALFTHGLGGNAQQIPKTSFSCLGRTSGYYADVSTGCQVYHMCDGLGRQFSYTCPNATLFQQRMLICDHWYMVNCSRATEDYDANLLIGQRNRPFVEDSETNPYSRTPRPDLLVAPSNLTEFNIVYRTGEQNLSPRDYVGVESEDESVTDQPTYFPPSHWSTEITKQPSTQQPIRDNPNDEEEYENTPRRPQSKIRGKAIDFSSANKNRNNLVVNYKSNFKATTPVYPESVKDTTSSVDDIGLLPPSAYANDKIDNFQENELLRFTQTNPQIASRRGSNADNVKYNFRSNFVNPTSQYTSTDELSKDIEERLQESNRNDRVKINYKSNFKATTPVYPNSVDATSLDPGQLGILPPQKVFVNFHSNFRATTPQYPTSVENTSPIPEEAGLLPPKESGRLPLQEEDGEPVHVNFQSNFKATTPKYPNFVDQTSPNPADAGLLPPRGNNNNNNVVVNFESNYKATTPQYPSHVDPTSPDPGEAGVLPPNGNTGNIDNGDDVQINFESRFKATTPKYPTYVDPTSPNPLDVGLLPPNEASSSVPFKSRFKATTPNYPTFVEQTSANPLEAGLVPPEETIVNFHSDFKATTPNYPTYVDPTSPDPGEAGLLAPQPDNIIGLVNPNQNSKFNGKQFNVPSKFDQPPSLEPDYNVGEEELQEIPGIKLLNFMKSFNNAQWQELRQAFRIPEYDFPLDDATRPSYDSIVNSFEPIVKK